MDKLAARKMNAELFESFTMLHKYGMPPHGGLGIGLERLTMQLGAEQHPRGIHVPA